MKINNTKFTVCRFDTLGKNMMIIVKLIFGLSLLCSTNILAQDEMTPEPVGQFGGWISSLAVPGTGNYAYFGGGIGFNVLDVSNPNQVKPAASLPFIGGSEVTDIVLIGSTAYIVNGKGLQIIDISNPLQPALIGTYETPGNASGVDVVGSVAYIADGNIGDLQIIDISNPTNPSLLSSYDI